MQLVKVVLLGDSGVGKTNIALRFTEDQFMTDSPSTIVVSMKPKELTIPGTSETFKINIWDTAGQEKYRSLTGMYYKDATAAILIYDTTNKQSFEGIKYWISELKNNNQSEIVIIIAGNKCDLIEKEQVSYEEAKNYAEEMHALFFLTSAKDGTNINNMFLEICAQLRPELPIEQIKEEMNKEKVIVLS
jgi:small GTP-binding protein